MYNNKTRNLLRYLHRYKVVIALPALFVTAWTPYKLLPSALPLLLTVEILFLLVEITPLTRYLIQSLILYRSVLTPPMSMVPNLLQQCWLYKSLYVRHQPYSLSVNSLLLAKYILLLSNVWTSTSLSLILRSCRRALVLCSVFTNHFQPTTKVEVPEGPLILAVPLSYKRPTMGYKKLV